MASPYLQSDVSTQSVVSVENQKYQLPKQKKQVKVVIDLKQKKEAKKKQLLETKLKENTQKMDQIKNKV